MVKCPSLILWTTGLLLPGLLPYSQSLNIKKDGHFSVPTYLLAKSWGVGRQVDRYAGR